MENEFSSAEDGDDVLPDKTKDKEYKRKVKEKLIKSIRKSVGTVESGKQVLNVAVIGAKGCGKSSFINTVIASLRKDKWQLYSKVGMNSGGLSSITQHFRSFSAKRDYYEEEPEVLFPTFIDINGLEDEDVNFNRALLRALFDGKIKENEKIKNVLDMYKNTPDDFKTKMLHRAEHLKIDRIIVVTTADPKEPLTAELFKCIREVANDLEGIPIFGVMTKKDLFRHNDKRITDFLKDLGIERDSFKLIVNYCPGANKKMIYHRTILPEIDIPVLEVIEQVINPHLGPRGDWHGFLARMLLTVIKWVCIPIQITIWAWILVLFTFMLYHDQKKIFATTNNTLNNKYEFTLPNVGFIYHFYRFLSSTLVIAPIAFSLFLLVLSNIAKQLVRVGLATLLLAILIVIFPTLVYIYENHIKHW
ncbi:uncharacterized protein [Mytilus edulis]|uniref:uncharacterized protein n=1 Tax=Mytilus edulis TaxID=6550 RepID=UPI0039EDE892